MCRRNVPLAQRRCGILVIAEPHNLRHLFLQITPIKRLACRTILYQAALRVIDRVTSENEQLLDSPFIYVPRQRQNAVLTRPARKLAENQGLSEIL